MCTCYTGEHCGCYGDARSYRRERARQAIASRLEHAVLDVLRSNRKDDSSIECDPDAPVASSLAARLAELIRSRLDDVHGQHKRVADLLVASGGSIYFWIDGDGAQHYAALDEHADAAAIRLAA